VSFFFFGDGDAPWILRQKKMAAWPKLKLFCFCFINYKKGNDWLLVAGEYLRI
jgi:hypothetical protein